MKQVYKELRRRFNEACLRRDRYKCRLCVLHDLSAILEVHHIMPRHDMPNDGYASTNGITLCQFHHEAVERNDRQYPDEQKLYEMIGTTFDQAWLDCENLIKD